MGGVHDIGRCAARGGYLKCVVFYFEAFNLNNKKMFRSVLNLYAGHFVICDNYISICF